ncbi:MAG: hypothetical protein F6K56_27805 [Moorea sp. SIO3G5]|nr:hypothetical protein [Moorena sp. SIO3G5]
MAYPEVSIQPSAVSRQLQINLVPGKHSAVSRWPRPKATLREWPRYGNGHAT